MSKIQVNVDDLKSFADIIGDIENQCDDALRHLNWDFSSFLADLPGVSPKRVKEVEEIYRNVIKKYQAKLDHAQQLVKHTEAAMRQAEKSIGDKAGEFGLEMLGYYDVQRVFGEYDPITGEKVSGADRLFATGMLALSLYPPGKAVGVTGKVAIKGANAGTKTSTKFGLFSIAKSLPSFISLKNVVSTGKVLEVFKGVYKQVVEAPLTATKLWMDRTVRQIADFRMPVIRTQLATPIGAMPLETVGEAFGQAKDTIVKIVNLGNLKKVGINSFKNTVREVPYGEHITRGRFGKKKLLENVKYTTKEGYEYITDSKGRITNVNAPELVLEKGKRNKYAQAHVGEGFRRKDDDGGHLIATMFKGSGDIDNLLPQNSKINRSGGEWYAMEKDWAYALKNEPPSTVSVQIDVVYSENSLRPTGYQVKYKIVDSDGEMDNIVKKYIPNEKNSVKKE